MERLARTRIVMWEGGALWLVDAHPVTDETPRTTDFHAHHAIQMVLNLDATFRVTASDGSNSAQMCLVAADASHCFEAEGQFALLFAEPESRLGRALTARYLTTGQLLADLQEEEDLAAALRALQADGWSLPQAGLEETGRRLLELVARGEQASIPDFRVRKVIAWAGEHLDQAFGLEAAAEIVGLSTGRLRHLFVEQTGLPLKTYLLWLRLSRALAIAAGGQSLTEAAHEAGFSDSPHLSRTFRRMFGVTPAALEMIA